MAWSGVVYPFATMLILEGCNEQGLHGKYVMMFLIVGGQSLGSVTSFMGRNRM